MIMYRFKIMPSELRLKFSKKDCFILVSKDVICALEYSLGTQLWGPGGEVRKSRRHLGSLGVRGAGPWACYCAFYCNYYC